MTRALLALTVVVTVVVGAGAARARECATMALFAAYRSGALSTSSLALQPRPPSVGSLASELHPVRVHWETDAVAARAGALLALVDAAWGKLTDDMGWPAPPPDDGEGGDERFDVYLAFVAPAAAETIAHGDVDPDDGKHASYSYTVIDPNADEELLPTLVHHELAHVMQFGVDLEESLMLAEASAVAFEALALPDVDAWSDDLDDFQRYPQAPLFTNGIDWRPVVGAESLYEYGAALFLLYLEQEHGARDGALIRRLWEASAQPDDTDENEPDWLDALPDEVGRSLPELVLDFASWRVLLSSWSVPGDGLDGGELLPGSATLRTLRLLSGTLDGAPLVLSRSQLPHQLGCLAVEVEAITDDIPLRVEVAAREDRPLGLAWVVGSPDQDRAERGRLDDVGAELALELDVASRDNAIIAVCDVGPADADELPEETEIELRVRNLDVPGYDAGPPPADDAGEVAPDGGVDAGPPICACQQAPARRAGPFTSARPYALAAITLLSLLVLVKRARGAVRRRKLYRDDGERRAAEGRGERAT